MSTWPPSIVPKDDDQTIYLVMDDLGRRGRAWREADAATTDLETVIYDLLDGHYNKPVRIIAFNTAGGWSRDVSGDIAHELRRWCDLQLVELPSSLGDFITRFEAPDRKQLMLRLIQQKGR